MEGGKANYLWLVLGFCLIAYVGNTQHIPGAPENGIPKDKPGITRMEEDTTPLKEGCWFVSGKGEVCPV